MEARVHIVLAQYIQFWAEPIYVLTAIVTLIRTVLKWFELIRWLFGTIAQGVKAVTLKTPLHAPA
jgi:hypothetical protein